MQVVIWSDPNYATGQTTLATVIATMIACKKGYKTFLTSTLLKDESLEHYSLKTFEREREHFVGETNIEGLIRGIKNGKLTKNKIKDYCFSLLAHSNLDLLQSGRILEDHETYYHQFEYLMSLVNAYYNVSVVDCDLGLEHGLIERVLHTTDVMVVVGDGNKYQFEKLKTMCETHQKMLEKIPKIFIHNKWEKSVVKPFKVKVLGIDPIYVPYTSALIEQSNQNNLVDYILRLNYGKKTDETKMFLKATNKVVERILTLGEEKMSHGTAT